MNLKLSFEVLGGNSRWPISLDKNINTLKQLKDENETLRHELQVLKSRRFYQEMFQHMCSSETRVFFTSNENLSAACNALLHENKEQMHCIQCIETELAMRGSEAQQAVYLQQELSRAQRTAQARVMEDLQTQQYFQQQETSFLCLLQKVNLLADSNHQLKQSVAKFQQHQQHHAFQQVCRPLFPFTPPRI